MREESACRKIVRRSFASVREESACRKIVPRSFASVREESACRKIVRRSFASMREESACRKIVRRSFVSVRKDSLNPLDTAPLFRVRERRICVSKNRAPLFCARERRICLEQYCPGFRRRWKVQTNLRRPKAGVNCEPAGATPPESGALPTAMQALFSRTWLRALARRLDFLPIPRYNLPCIKF